MDKEIEEIKCNAKNCVYNQDGSKCVAGNIEVGTCNARSSTETLCATFQACTDNNSTSNSNNTSNSTSNSNSKS